MKWTGLGTTKNPEFREMKLILKNFITRNPEKNPEEKRKGGEKEERRGEKEELKRGEGGEKY